MLDHKNTQITKNVNLFFRSLTYLTYLYTITLQFCSMLLLGRKWLQMVSLVELRSQDLISFVSSIKYILQNSTETSLYPTNVSDGNVYVHETYPAVFSLLFQTNMNPLGCVLLVKLSIKSKIHLMWMTRCVPSRAPRNLLELAGTHITIKKLSASGLWNVITFTMGNIKGIYRDGISRRLKLCNRLIGNIPGRKECIQIVTWQSWLKIYPIPQPQPSPLHDSSDFSETQHYCGLYFGFSFTLYTCPKEVKRTMLIALYLSWNNFPHTSHSQ